MMKIDNQCTYDDNDELHSYDDKPSLISTSGSKIWHHHGRIHRDNDKPAVIHHDNTQMWYKNGFKHRDNDQPAITYEDGTQFWYLNGIMHRDKAPAIIHPDGTYNWYYDGDDCTFDEYVELSGLSDEEVVEIGLIYGVEYTHDE